MARLGRGRLAQVNDGSLTPRSSSLTVVPFLVAVSEGVLSRERVPVIAGIGMGILLLFMMFQIPMALFAIVLAAALVWVGTHPSETQADADANPAGMAN